MSSPTIATPVMTIPIRLLNPYQGKWTVKARVTSKSKLTNYTNAKGPGKVFSFDIVDSKGDEIHITCFNAVADQFYDYIEERQVYSIANGMLKPASKTFNHLRNEYEIYLDKSSKIERCAEDDNTIPVHQFHFQPINEIGNMEKYSLVDVVGLVMSINSTTPIVKKDGTETVKRNLELRDMSGYTVDLTMWGKFCNVEGDKVSELLDSASIVVIAVKSGRINEFNGKSVYTVMSTQLIINPDIPEAHKLRLWYSSDESKTTSIRISKQSATNVQYHRKLISQIKEEGLGKSGEPNYIIVTARISYVKPENFSYTACPLMVGSRKCNKKVTKNEEGHWWCGRCDQSVPDCEIRYILQLQLQDCTGTTYVTAFQEVAEAIMGISAKDLTILKEGDEEKFSDTIRMVKFKLYSFKLIVKEELYNNERLVKLTVVKAEAVDFSSESQFLLDSISNIGE